MHVQIRGLLALTSLLLCAAIPSPSPEAKAAFARGERALAAGKLDQAVAAYQEAIASSPGFAAALNGLGMALFRQDRKEEAVQQFRAATAADPAFARAWQNLGFAARKVGDATTAVTAYEMYVQLAPDDPDGVFGLAEAYRLRGDAPKAIAAYERYVAREKRPSEQKWVEKAQEQIAALRRFAATAPVPDATPPTPAGPPVEGPASPALARQRIAEGDRLMQDSRYLEAAAAYQDATAAHPSSVEAFFKLGRALATMGQYQQAIERWGRVLELAQEPQIRKSAQDNIARARARLVASGGPAPSSAVAPSPAPDAESIREKAHRSYELGVARIAARDYAGALASLTETIQLEPALAIPYVARGSANIGLRRYAQAVADYRYALELDGTLASPLYGLGEAYRGLRRPEEARQWYERYIAAKGPDAREDLRAAARRKLGGL